ncbi:unnamed protein product [Allacma fusca]|uniref:DUF5641 domain-containing protein n=1 Tax=Allacma fusca TaxID=39272 RepID=A0A8J2NTG8_9HEXA|nr:unnamed protein product [Allacma fusca]
MDKIKTRITTDELLRVYQDQPLMLMEDLKREPVSALTTKEFQRNKVNCRNQSYGLFTNRSKWSDERPILKVDDLVDIRDERFPPQQWRMAVVRKVPGTYSEDCR